MFRIVLMKCSGLEFVKIAEKSLKLIQKPKETFVKLPEEKKDKIIKAAKKEFARVPFEQTSIKNIVEDADIARGSFYQYFESKEDLLRVYFKYTF